MGRMHFLELGAVGMGDLQAPEEEGGSKVMGVISYDAWGCRHCVAYIYLHITKRMRRRCFEAGHPEPVVRSHACCRTPSPRTYHSKRRRCFGAERDAMSWNVNLPAPLPLPPNCGDSERQLISALRVRRSPSLVTGVLHPCCLVLLVVLVEV